KSIKSGTQATRVPNLNILNPAKSQKKNKKRHKEKSREGVSDSDGEKGKYPWQSEENAGLSGGTLSVLAEEALDATKDAYQATTNQIALDHGVSEWLMMGQGNCIEEVGAVTKASMDVKVKIKEDIDAEGDDVIDYCVSPSKKRGTGVANVPIWWELVIIFEMYNGEL
ncbi:hypothetical protein PQX77_006134, partial [Marasmius sp. AFHP31]